MKELEARIEELELALREQQAAEESGRATGSTSGTESSLSLTKYVELEMKLQSLEIRAGE